MSVIVPVTSTPGLVCSEVVATCSTMSVSGVIWHGRQ